MTRTAQRPSTFDRWVVEENSWDQRHDDREYLPTFSAHREDEEAWRLSRLARVYGTARTLFQVVEQRPLPATIVVALHDHRGELVVTVPSEEWWPCFEAIFQLAWRSENEDPVRVRHMIART